MFKLLRTATLPAARWVTFLPLGVGDDHATSFPFDAALTSSGTGVVVFAGPWRMNHKIRLKEPLIEQKVDENGDARDVKRTFLQFKGKVVKNEDGLPCSVEFEQPVPEGMAVTLAVLDLQHPEGSFQVYPMTKGTRDAMNAGFDAERVRLKLKPGGDLPGDSTYRIAFVQLTADWCGVVDEKGEKIPCEEKTKDSFLAQFDSVNYGAFVTEASSAFASGVRRADEEALGN